MISSTFSGVNAVQLAQERDEVEAHRAVVVDMLRRAREQHKSYGDEYESPTATELTRILARMQDTPTPDDAGESHISQAPLIETECSYKSMAKASSQETDRS